MSYKKRMRPEILNSLFCSIDSIKGIGSRYLKLVSNLIGGDKIVDLLWHLPYNMIDRTYSCPLAHLETGKIWTGLVTINEHIEPKTKKQPYYVIVSDGTKDLTLTFFKYYKDSIKRSLPIGAQRVISGKIEYFNGSLHMNHPDYIALPENQKNIQTIEPVYMLTKGVTNKMMLFLAQSALSKLPDLAEWQDEHFLSQQGFMSFQNALEKVHHPQLIEDLNPLSKARERLAYDELLSNQLTLAIARLKHKKKSGRIVEGNGLLRQKLIQSLPFELTDAQKRVIGEIENDQKSSYQGLRLVQGDVGSGKTIVAFLSMLNAVEAGFQAAIMAPLGILAKQHFETMLEWAETTGVRVALLTGKIKGKKRTEILEKLQKGEIDILVGTHALFTEDVTFKDLALVVVDEQHRFGVKQRLELSKKGNLPDIVVMTATPIPRTLVLTEYGDMSYSKIDELPKGRKPVNTRVMSLKKIPEVVEGLKRKLKEGARAYWICPLIEESEKSDLAAAEKRFELLKEIFPNQVGLIHGKMKENEKDEIMESFKKGQISILVSTTVVEVGVNVPEATVMVIERAERFGLSQLHQLRGRIKRSSNPSSCLLLYGFPLSQTAQERLTVMRQSEDGFVIAEKDLDLRGGGEILGVKQSGFTTFKLADLAFHKNLLFTAHQDAEMIINNDPNLESSRGQRLKTLLYLFRQDRALETYKAG